VSRQGLATEADAEKQGARGTIHQCFSHHLSNERIGSNASHHPDMIDTGDQSVCAADDSFLNTSWQAAELKYSPGAQSVSVTNLELVAEFATILVNAKEPIQVSNSEVQTPQGDSASGHLPAI
jgi:hypothetical protein